MIEGVWLVGVDGRTIYANEAMGRLLGSTPAGVRGRLMTDFLAEAQSADVEAFLTRLRTHAGGSIQLRFRRDDGTDLFALVDGNQIATPEGVDVGTMLNVSDITGKHAIDAQLIQNQRLEAIGQFAGGIAHDFNNLLTAIHGYAELVRANLAYGDPIGDDIDQVLASADRASAITRRLLAFTRRQVLIPVDIDPAQVIVDLLPILRPLMGDDMKITLDVQAEHGWIRVDPAQLEQVIVNLAINARDAMPTGGTVTISVHDLEPADSDRPEVASTAPFVRISVADTGTGMDEVTKGRIFEPFFTTKRFDRGTGLGLSTVFGIVAQSGGQVQVESALGEGSTFHVDLPHAVVGVMPHPRQALDSAPRRPGVVLLVEDESVVREFARRSLEAEGYSVLVAADADQALRASERWAEGIDVLVTDLIMPGIRGSELAARIRAERPSIGVVFMSGFAADAIGSGNELHAIGEFLPKPFSMETLSRAVGRAADRALVPGTPFRTELPLHRRTSRARNSA